MAVTSGILIGYARFSTDKQDLEANRQILLELGVAVEHIYLDKAYSGTNRDRPGLDRALAAVRAGDTLVTPKLDRLARSVPDAREIGDSLAARDIRLQLGTMIYHPADPMGKMFFQHLGHLRRVRGRPAPDADPRRYGDRQGEGQAQRPGAEVVPARQAHLLKLHAAEEHTIAELAELFEVSRPTVYRVLDRHRTSADA